MDNSPRFTIQNIDTTSLFTIQEEHGYISGIDNIKIAEEILSNQVRVTENYTNSRFEDTKIEFNDDSEIVKLLACMTKLAQMKELVLTDYWSQIHRPLESTDIHNHFAPTMDYRLSWVYYVKVPEGAGSLVFHLNDDVPVAIVEPEVGKFIIFPNWLKHKVTKNLSNDIRISVAGNFAKLHNIG